MIDDFNKIDVHIMSEVILTRLYCKTSERFRQFLLALKPSAKKSEIKKKLMMSTETCGRIQKNCMPENFFSKNNIRYEILNHLYFGPNFFFRRTALGGFSQCFFFSFLILARYVGRHFYAARHHQKASYGPDKKQERKYGVNSIIYFYLSDAITV